MSIEHINKMFDTKFQSWDEVSDHELRRMLIALLCEKLDAQVFICGKPTITREGAER